MHTYRYISAYKIHTQQCSLAAAPACTTDNTGKGSSSSRARRPGIAAASAAIAGTQPSSRHRLVKSDGPEAARELQEAEKQPVRDVELQHRALQRLSHRSAETPEVLPYLAVSQHMLFYIMNAA